MDVVGRKVDSYSTVHRILILYIFWGNIPNVVRTVEETTESSDNNKKRGNHANKTKDGNSITSEIKSVGSH